MKTFARVLLGIGLVLLPALALAQTTNLGGVADNVRLQNLPNLMFLLTSGLFVTGVGLVGSALWGLKQMGGSNSHSLGITAKHPLLTGLAGVGLIYLTTVAGVGGVTLFGSAARDVTIQGTTTLE